MRRISPLVPIGLGVALLLVGAAWALNIRPRIVAQIGVPIVPKDAFPTFDNPKMLTAAEAEAQRLVFERDMIIGVAGVREAKAYPITIMDVHELGNDTIDGMPIAASVSHNPILVDRFKAFYPAGPVFEPPQRPSAGR